MASLACCDTCMCYCRASFKNSEQYTLSLWSPVVLLRWSAMTRDFIPFHVLVWCSNYVLWHCFIFWDILVHTIHCRSENVCWFIFDEQELSSYNNFWPTCYLYFILQCFYTVDWVRGRASCLRKARFNTSYYQWANWLTKGYLILIL